MNIQRRFTRLMVTSAVYLAAITLPHVQAGEPGMPPPGTIQIQGADGTWSGAPATLPAGTKTMLLEGDPKKEGLFTMRIKLPAGARVQPHWHPRDERVTILSGQVRIGFGDSFDESVMTTFGPGSYYVNPPKSHHYALIVQDTVVQLTGFGPWELHYLKPQTESDRAN